MMNEEKESVSFLNISLHFAHVEIFAIISNQAMNDVL